MSDIPLILFSILVALLWSWTAYLVTRIAVEKSDLLCKLFAKMTYGKAVLLESEFGKTYRTIAYKSPSGKLYADVYFATKVGGVILLENGEVSEWSESSYITSWSLIK